MSEWHSQTKLQQHKFCKNVLYSRNQRVDVSFSHYWEGPTRSDQNGPATCQLPIAGVYPLTSTTTLTTSAKSRLYSENLPPTLPSLLSLSLSLISSPSSSLSSCPLPPSPKILHAPSVIAMQLLSLLDAAPTHAQTYVGTFCLNPHSPSRSGFHKRIFGCVSRLRLAKQKECRLSKIVYQFTAPKAFSIFRQNRISIPSLHIQLSFV